MVANIESPLFKVARDVEENIEEYNISDPTIPLNNIVSECFVVSEETVFKGHQNYLQQEFFHFGFSRFCTF